MLGDWGGTNEADRAHLRVVAQRIHDGAATVDQVYDSFWQSGFLQEFKRTPHGERNTLGGFQYESISARNRIRKKPEHDHRGKIKRSDGRDDSQGLANLHFIHAGRHVFEDVALHHHGNAAGDFHVLDAAAQFGFCFGKGLSIFESDQAREFVEIFFEQVFQLEKILHALAGRSTAPCRKGLGGSLHSSVHVVGGGEGRAREKFGRCGIGDVRELCRGGWPPSAIHIVQEFRRLGCHGTAHALLLGHQMGWGKSFAGQAPQKIGSS